MPIFGGSNLLGPGSMGIRPFGGPAPFADNTNNAFQFNPLKKKPLPGNNGLGFNSGVNGGLGFNSGILSLLASSPQAAPNLGPMASNFSKLFTPPSTQQPNPFQYF